MKKYKINYLAISVCLYLGLCFIGNLSYSGAKGRACGGCDEFGASEFDELGISGSKSYFYKTKLPNRSDRAQFSDDCYYIDDPSNGVKPFILTGYLLDFSTNRAVLADYFQAIDLCRGVNTDYIPPSKKQLEALNKAMRKWRKISKSLEREIEFDFWSSSSDNETTAFYWHSHYENKNVSSLDSKWYVRCVFRSSLTKEKQADVLGQDVRERHSREKEARAREKQEDLENAHAGHLEYLAYEKELERQERIRVLRQRLRQKVPSMEFSYPSDGRWKDEEEYLRVMAANFLTR